MGAFVEYQYDARYRQHVVTILSGGQGIVPLRSYIEWDFAFGLRKKETDWNRNSIHYVCIRRLRAADRSVEPV